MTVVESFQSRWDLVVSATLEMLADGTDTVTYSIAGTRAELQCLAHVLPEDHEDYDPDDEHYHEVPALTIIVNLDRADGFHWAGRIHIPLVESTPSNGAVQMVLGLHWERMVFDHAAWAMQELDDKMDDVAEAAEYDPEYDSEAGE